MSSVGLPVPSHCIYALLILAVSLAGCRSSSTVESTPPPPLAAGLVKNPTHNGPRDSQTQIQLASAEVVAYPGETLELSPFGAWTAQEQATDTEGLELLDLSDIDPEDEGEPDEPSTTKEEEGDDDDEGSDELSDTLQAPLDDNTDAKHSLGVTIADVIAFGLENNTILKRDGDYLSLTNQVLTNPEAVASHFDQDIVNSGYLFGSRGPQAALADFDAQITTSMLWGRDETIQNNQFLSGGLFPGETLVEETGVFTATLAKTLRSGGQVSVSQDWNYTGNNLSSRLFQSAYNGTLRAEYRQPLLAGHGRDVNDIAGPIGTRVEGVGGIGQGVSIAEIRVQRAAVQFQSTLNGWARDVEVAYWRLGGAKEALRIAEESLEVTDAAWQNVRDRLQSGTEGGGRADEAELRSFVVDARIRVAEATQDFHDAEARLRRLIGKPVTDDSLLNPTEIPEGNLFFADQESSFSEALAQRPELARQQLLIHSLQLQLFAAEELNRPRLDFVSGYRVNGFGDRFLGGEGPLEDANRNLFDGDNTGWNLGFEFFNPVHRRLARTRVLNVERQLAKARAVLSEQQTEIEHEVAQAVRTLKRLEFAMENRELSVQASEERLAAAESLFEVDGTTTALRTLLQARQTQRDAEIQLMQARSEYASALAELRFRVGSSLANLTNS